ncbi:hypothetical protein ACJ73_01588 [Blastomyces percursus]|uniref:Uncharacterized protein n=1 Tax=Blastomyces percursus TaxID=1658174 RepID=A0A1J9QFZ6_9EURO|nr:hypothetical protein ACJ73_01588 [Blastomyces percursus]
MTSSTKLVLYSTESDVNFFSDQSSLSSVPTGFDEREAELILEGYQPRDNEDRTKDVLFSFLRFLAGEGKNGFCKLYHKYKETIMKHFMHLASTSKQQFYNT